MYGNKNQRITAIDGLRGYAALTVMLYHFGPDYFIQNSALDWMWFGDYGPHIFFMISGLVIGLISGSQDHPLSFLKRRYHRLIPTYWAALTLTTVTLFLFAGPELQPGPLTYLANITLLHQVFGIEHVDLVYWTLIVEITFYILFACFLIPAKQTRTHIVILGLWLLLSYACLMFEAAAEGELGLALSALKQVLILEHAPFFIIGLVMANIRKGNYHSALLALVVFSYIHIWLMYPPSRAAYLSGGFVIFSALVFYPSPFLSSKYLQLLGWVSYPLYLIHREIGYLLIRQYEGLGWPGFGPALAVCVSLVIAYWLSCYFDRSGRPLRSPSV